MRSDSLQLSYSDSLQLSYIEWGPNGKITRIIKTWPLGLHMNPLDRIVYSLQTLPYLVEFDVNWCERDKLYYFHQSGGGRGRIFLPRTRDPEKVRFKFWSDTGVEFEGWDELIRKNRELTEDQINGLGYDRVSRLPASTQEGGCHEIQCWRPSPDLELPVEEESGWSGGKDFKGPSPWLLSGHDKPKLPRCPVHRAAAGDRSARRAS